MKTNIIFDLSGTTVNMRPPKLLVKRVALLQLSKNADLSLITGAKKTETLNILRKLNVLKFFKRIITKDDSIFQKPDPRLMKMAKVEKYKTFYVGDTKKDFLFAKNAKVDFLYIGKRKYGIYQNGDVNEVIKFLVKKSSK
jgi:phosphoglycolate phosphatase-like HAD superfamily hydrolase